MIKFILIFFYRPFYSLLKGLLLFFKPFASLKLQKWIEFRESSSEKINSQGLPVYLFHASSGEIEYVKSLIRELKELKIEIFIAVSYSSPSAVKLFENIRPYVDLFIPLPWDQPSAITYFITQLNPHSVFFARTDLWPEFIYQLNQQRIKIYVISYNPSFTFFNRIIIAILLRQAQAIFCIQPQQSQLLKSLLPARVHISAPGDTRFDQVFWRLQQPSKIYFLSTIKYAVLGSTWSQDESYFLPILNEIISCDYKLVWSPHEIDFETMNRIKQILIQKNLKFKMFSEVKTPSLLKIDEFDILIVDQIGYLADFYRQADWAFVGGSFKSKVHSVMEPICCAIPVITGPKILNSPEAIKYSRITMNNLKVVQIAQTSAEFLTAVHNIKSTHKEDFKRLLIGNLEQNRHATKKIIQFIARMTRESLNF